MFNRSRRNLARWFTLVMGGILVSFAGALYYQESVKQLNTMDRLLYKKAQVMSASIQYELRKGNDQVELRSVPLLGGYPLPSDSEVVYARWYTAEGKLRQFFGTVPTRSELGQPSEFQTVQLAQDGEETPTIWLRQITLPVNHSGKVMGYLQLAMPLTAVQDLLQEFLLLLVLTVLVTLGIVSLVGWFLSGFAMQPIQQAYDQLQRFTSDASHELRAPLATILSNAQVGLMAPMDKAAAKHGRLENIAETAKSMNVLVSRLLFLARRVGPLPLELLQPVNLNEFLKELVASHAMQKAAEHVSLKLELPPDAVVVEAEPELLQQAIANLFNNACRYTATGGQVHLRLFETKPQVAVIQVEDTGVGIPEADLPHLFERFYRVDKERNRETGGFGLGLAIALQIVEAHGGHISVSSHFGKGSLFQIELPKRHQG